MKKTLRWKFLRHKRNRIASDSGTCYWKLETWKKEKKVDICHSGFHCSKKIIQALGYVKGEYLAIAECRGESVIQDDKEVYREMKLVKVYKWTKEDSVEMAIFSAKLVLGIFEKKYPKDMRPREAIEAAKKYLRGDITRDELLERSRAAAAAAAAAAAYAAAAAAAAAYAAAYAAAAAAAAAYAAAAADADAAYAAAAAAARKAKREEIYTKIEAWLKRRVKKLQEVTTTASGKVQ